MSWMLFKFQSSFGLRLCSIMRNPLCLDWHWGLLCIIFGFNASIHQGRLPFEEAMVKAIRWEVKNRVECNSYCNCSKQENTVFGGISCSVLQNSSSQWSLSPLTNGFGNFMLQCLWCSVGCFYIGAVLFGCVLNYKHYNMKFPNLLVKGDKDQ